MDKPIELTPKLVKVEAMQYNGENSGHITNWVLSTDPMAICQERIQFPELSPLWFVDGNTRSVQSPALKYLLVQHYYGIEIHVFVGDWLFKEREHFFTRHRHGEVRSKYDIPGFPDPLNRATQTPAH